MSINQYYALGSSGLRVSRLALGTMTFGQPGWGSDEAKSREIFNAFVEAGGNFFDTADAYSEGRSEALLGKFVAERKMRDQAVISTKFTVTSDPKNPNAGGNGRKNIMRAVDASLARLGADWIDLYIMHVWDGVTPAEEVLGALDDLVRAGKILHFAVSDCPAWYAARMQAISECRGLHRPCAAQMEYSLIARDIEHEFTPLALHHGLALMVWSPLASGLLSGKYKPSEDADGPSGVGRLESVKDDSNSAFEKLKAQAREPRNWRIISELEAAAREVDRPMAQVALNWVANRPGVASVLIGASKVDQIESNVAALGFDLPDDIEMRLDEASTPYAPFPHSYLDETQAMIAGACVIGQRPRSYAAFRETVGTSAKLA